MSALDTLVDINISQQTSAVPVASFSIPLIIGPTQPSSGIVNSFTDPEDMLAAGYELTSPEYLYALELYEQAVTPTEFYVGMRTAAVIQVSTGTPNVSSQTVQHYIANIGGTAYDFTSDSSPTAAKVVTGLLALINAGAGDPLVIASGTTTLILTARTAGAGFSTAGSSANLPIVVTTANNGIATDLAAIIAQNNSWYGIALCSNTDADITQLAAAVEALKKIFIGVSADAAIPTTSTTDIASIMASKSYKRTALMYSATANDGKEAAWMGGQLPLTPGSNNWAYKSLVGITPDSNTQITDSQRSILIGNPVAGLKGKNVNIYNTIGGVSITQMGTMIGGQFIDITIGLDWLEANLQASIYQQLVNAAKIPYTDPGTTVLIQAVKSVLDQGVVNGLIDGGSPITITAPLVATVPSSQRANRIAPTISFSCRLAGAFNAVVVNGTVTV